MGASPQTPYDDLWAEAASVAAQYRVEPARWCEASYAGMFARSVVATALGHVASRVVSPWVGLRARDAPLAAALDADSRLVSTVNAVVAVRNYLRTTEKTTGTTWLLLPFRTVLSASPYESVFVASCDRDAAMLGLAGYLAFDCVVAVFVLCSGTPRASSGTLGNRAVMTQKRRRRRGGDDDPLVAAHHVVVVVAFALAIRWRLATGYAAALLLNEVSAPFVNARALFRTNSDSSLVFICLDALNSMCLVATYFVFRIAWTLAVVLRAFDAWRASSGALWRVGVLVGGADLAVVVTLSALLCGHLAVNAVWFAHVLSHVKRALWVPDKDIDTTSQGRQGTATTTTTTNGHAANGPPVVSRSRPQKNAAKVD